VNNILSLIVGICIITHVIPTQIILIGGRLFGISQTSRPAHCRTRGTFACKQQTGQ